MKHAISRHHSRNHHHPHHRHHKQQQHVMVCKTAKKKFLSKLVISVQGHITHEHFKVFMIYVSLDLKLININCNFDSNSCRKSRNQRGPNIQAEETR